MLDHLDWRAPMYERWTVGTARKLVSMALVVLALFVTAACGDDGTDDATSPSESPASAGSQEPSSSRATDPGPDVDTDQYIDPMRDINPEALLAAGLELVDQDALHACLGAGRDCEAEVPGLAECEARGLICNEQEWRDQQAYWEADPSGIPLPESEAISVARMYADAYNGDLASVSDLPVEVEEVHAPELLAGLRPTALPDTNSLLAVTVRGEITNTDVPYPAEPQTYDVYTVVVDLSSGKSVGVCMGCSSATH